MNRLFASLILLFGLTHSTSVQARRSVALAVEIAVSPMPEDKTLQVRAIISDAETREVLAGPTIILARGEDASITTQLPTGTEVTLSVTTSASTPELRYEVQVVKRGRIRGLQKATIKLDG